MPWICRRSLRGALLGVLVVVGFARPASAWDAAWAIRSDADILPFLQVVASVTVPLGQNPLELHGLGGGLSGGVIYVDDDKVGVLRIADLDYTSIYRSQRQRYDAGSFPAVGIFDLHVQLRLRGDLHLLYGLGLSRGGIQTHAGNGGLSFHFGWVLPLWGWQAEDMREYQRSYIQLECIPLAGSLLADLMQEGFYDRELPTAQLVGEVGLRGRHVTRGGVITASARLSFSYLHQHSYYFLVRFRWVGPLFFRQRLRPVIQADYVWPARPFRGHISDEGQQLIYGHHVKVTLGVAVRL